MYPSEIELFGYSSRNQKDKDAYINIKRTRIKAKHNELSQEFLDYYGVTMKDVNMGLKLPINAYTGALRAPFNPLFDNLAGFSICTTGQLLILQLIHDLQTIPTLEMISSNTDAVAYTIDEKYLNLTDEVLKNWQELTGLELEDDNVQKIVMRDINNYVEILKIGENDYDIHYKGGELTRGEHKFKWNKEKQIFEYSYKPSLKSNSMSICSEALLKFLLFETPIEETINGCNDIFRFQIISHLGSTYEKCVQESPNGDIELQRNNRIYAGKKSSGTIIKVKADGRRDSLANCPTNPVVDNDNKLTIDDINKEWYIDYARQKADDFLGIKRLEDYKKDELLELAKEYGLDIDSKMKKVEIIELLKGRNKIMKKDELIAENERLQKEIESLKEGVDTMTPANERVMLLKKINEFRKQVRSYDFKLDKVMDDKHGGGEYSSINQVYNCVQDLCLSCGLDFQFDCVEEIRFEKNGFVSSVGAPRHIVETRCLATLTDIDTGASKQYCVLGAGSDTIDKGLSASITMAFRQWFTKNFSPKQNFPWDEEDTPTEVSESPQPKTPIFIPPKVKEEIVEKVVNTEQQETTKDVSDTIAEMIMEMRMLTGDENYGASTLSALQQGTLNDVQIDSARTTLEIKLAGLKGAK